MLLIVASELDSHADAVIIALKSLGFTHVMRVDLEVAHTVLTLEIEPQVGSLKISDSLGIGRHCSLDDIRTVWWRRSVSFTSRIHLEIPRSDVLDSIETYWALRLMLEALPSERFPFGHPVVMKEAGNKLHQLRLATEMGLKTPPTIFTNDSRALRNFASQFREVVLKPLKSTRVREVKQNEDYALLSRPVSPEKLFSILEHTPSVAAFCQERAEKTADIRLNVFPSESIACRIDTSTLPKEDVDWRPTTFQHKHELIETPKEIDIACREFLHRMNLTWGAFDFGLTSQGEWVFFECNPNGQWLWIELATGAPLSTMFAKSLVDHHEREVAISQRVA
jgi:glutathione synthase/RimK-type ligase-like ATP-grasp enzyme